MAQSRSQLAPNARGDREIQNASETDREIKNRYDPPNLNIRIVSGNWRHSPNIHHQATSLRDRLWSKVHSQQKLQFLMDWQYG